jgi:serine/threonine-protein phosphatase 6 regulatory ankyrin repeat subunit A
VFIKLTESMARKKASRKQPSSTLTLVPHRSGDLHELLERAKKGNSVADMKAYLDAGGSAFALVDISEDSRVPLLYAVVMLSRHPHKELGEILRLLVQAGVHVDASTTAFGINTSGGWMNCMARSCCTVPLLALIEHGANPVHQFGGARTTALHQVASVGSYDHCEALLIASHGDAAKVTESDGRTPLFNAVAFNHKSIVRLLHKHESALNVADYEGITPLLFAAMELGYSAVVKHLLSNGADVNAAAHNSTTPLYAAVVDGDIRLVQTLLDHGADLSALDADGQNVLFPAVAWGHAAIMQLLAASGADVHSRNRGGVTLLMTAAQTRQPAAAEWLISQGVSVNATDDVGGTALHHAATFNSCAQTVKVLLANGAAVDKPDKEHRTALVLTAYDGNVTCAELLIVAGADTAYTVSTAFMTCLHLAVHHKQTQLVQLLLAHTAAAVINSFGHSCSCCGATTVLMACSNPATLKLLLAASADVHATTERGDTCLHVAAVHGHPAPVLCMLIKAGADLHAVNCEGKTAAEVARDKGRELTESLLLRAAKGSGEH